MNSLRHEAAQGSPSTHPARKQDLMGEPGTAFGCPRDFHGNQYVYTVISPRTQGLSVGINLNPAKDCNFDCIYCEVNRKEPPRAQHLDIETLARELRETLSTLHSGQMRVHPPNPSRPQDLLPVQSVSLSGDGEPTQCPEFTEAVLAILHVRACRTYPFFKLVLVTNASGLHLPDVRQGLSHFTSRDEIWVKLEAGSEAYYQRINRSDVPLEAIMKNIRNLGRRRPVVIQSLFPQVRGEALEESEIEQYACRLRNLKEEGVQIAQVQICSATRPSPQSSCSHLPLKTLSGIANKVREIAGLSAEVY